MPILIAGKCNFHFNLQIELFSKVEVGSKTFAVKHASVRDETFAYGDFFGGFELDLFGDAQFTHEVAEEIFIGAHIYAEAEWKITTLVDRAAFFIQRCEVAQDSRHIPIIDGNCYSRLLGTQMLNANGKHLQSLESKFRSKFSLYF